MIFYDNYKNVEYTIVDYQGQQKQLETSFSTDSMGGFCFMVDWSKNVHINIFVNGQRLSMPFERRFNNEHIVNPMGEQ